MNKTLMKGCGIGCGVVALLILMLVGGGAWFAREMGREYKTVQETEESLFAAEGDLQAWSPPAGLVPGGERLAVFLAVRADLAEWRTQLETDMDRFRQERERGGLLGTWNSIRSGSDMGLTFARFWGARNRALVEQGMGPAEYAWLYGLAYYAHLGRDPGAGAQPFDISGGSGVQVKVGQESETPPEAARRRAHDLLAAVLERAEGADAGVGAADVADENRRLAADPRRVPWQDGLPAPLEAAFAPHAAALEATWSEAVNPLELMFQLDEGR
jgi:hypothetical protein